VRARRISRGARTLAFEVTSPAAMLEITIQEARICLSRCVAGEDSIIASRRYFRRLGSCQPRISPSPPFVSFLSKGGTFLRARAWLTRICRRRHESVIASGGRLEVVALKIARA